MHRDAILSYGLSLSLDFSISSSPGEEIDFHDRLNFPGYETYQQQRGFDPWNTFTFIRSNKSKSKLISFLPIGFPRYANIARISCNSYSNRWRKKAVVNPRLYIYIYTHSLDEITHRNGNLVDKLSVANSYNLAGDVYAFVELFLRATLFTHANLYQFHFWFDQSWKSLWIPPATSKVKCLSLHVSLGDWITAKECNGRGEEGRQLWRCE